MASCTAMNIASIWPMALSSYSHLALMSMCNWHACSEQVKCLRGKAALFFKDCRSMMQDGSAGERERGGMPARSR